jgi:hypothetical protein
MQFDAAAENKIHEVTREGVSPQEVINIYQTWAKDYDEVSFRFC